MANKQLYACIAKTEPHHKILENHGNGKAHNIHIARAAFQKGKTWPNGSTIKVAFFKGSFVYNGRIHTDSGYTAKKAKFVQDTITKYIVPLVHLRYEWDVPPDESDIRISFVKSMGAFSVLGIDCLHVPKEEVTMNLGWTDQDRDSSDREEVIGTGAVIVHEFGHSLGMIHEHSRADADLEWNKELVYTKMAASPNEWDKKTVDEQISTSKPKKKTRLHRISSDENIGETRATLDAGLYQVSAPWPPLFH